MLVERWEPCCRAQGHASTGTGQEGTNGPASAAALADTLRTRLDWNAVVPRFQERVRID